MTDSETLKLFGHDDTIARLYSHIESDTLGHSWLITGPKGIGKATLAYRLAESMLSGEINPSLTLPPDHPVRRRVAAGSHTDLLIIKGGKPGEEGKDSVQQEINAEQARRASTFFAHTPAESEWRVVIIDSVDEMNTHAANAMLKTLEEPPPRSLLLLVSHNPGRLLPTIRSRCRQLRMSPLSPDAFANAMRQALPDAHEKLYAKIGILSDNAPGVALELYERQAVEQYQWLLDYLANPSSQHDSMLPFIDSIASGERHTNWRMLARLIAVLLQRMIASAYGEIDGNNAFSNEQEAFGALLRVAPAPVWADRAGEVAEQFSVAAKSHLDYKSVLTVLLHGLDTSQTA